MMNKQTIEEIEILISANVDKARKDLSKLVKEVKSVTSNISDEFQKMNKSGSFDGLTKDINNYKNQVKKIGEEVRKVKVNIDGASFSFTPNTGDFQKQYDEAIKNINAEESGVPLNALGDPADTKYLVTQVQAAKEELSEADTKAQQLKNNLKNFDTLSLREQFRTVGMQLEQMIPAVGKVTNAIKDRFNDSTSMFGLMKSKAQELGAGFNNIKSKVQAVGNSFENIRAKFDPIADNIKSVAYTSSTAMKNAFTQISNFVSKPIGKIKEFINKIRGVKTETDKAKKGSSNFGSVIGKSISKGVQSIKKFGLSLLGVRQIFSAVSKAASSYLSFDTQLNDTIQNCWNALGSLLAPILEYVVGLFSKLVSVVAAFVKALTGVDLVARANAKALNNQAKASKKAGDSAKQLSGIDDIDTLSSGSGDSGDSPTQITTEAIDMSPIEAALERIKGIFGQIFEPFKSAWETTGAGVVQSIQDMFTSLKDLGASVGESIMSVWTNGTGQTIIENTLLGWQQIFDIVGNLGDALQKAWEKNDNGTKTIQHICDIFEDVQEFGLSIGETLNKWVLSETFQDALSRVFDFVEDIFEVAQDITDWIVEMYDKYLKPVIEDKLLPAIDEIIIAISDIWNVVKPCIEKSIDMIKKYLEPVIQVLSSAIGGIIDVIRGIAQFISGVFTNDWKKAWNGIKTIFTGSWEAAWGVLKGIINLIIAGFENFVNVIITALNTLLKPLKKLGDGLFKLLGANITIPTISKVSIPRLATGTVAYEEMPAIIGEYANARSNPEIVSPVSMMKDSFRAVLNEFEFGGTRIETLKIDVAGENFYQGTVDYINTENSRKGVNIIKEV